MSKVRAKRPSPALVISLLALFVALGGSAYAAKKIGTKEIKNNAITAAKIKKGAVTTPKIKDNAITGAKIAEASLGAVPSAQHAATAASADTAKSAASATTAETATNAVNATNAANFDRYFTTGLKKVGLNQTAELAKAGPFTFYGSCKDTGGGNYEARTYLTTSEPNSLMSSYTDSYEEFNFEPGTDAELGEYASDTTPYWSWDEYSYDAEWTAIDAAGTMVLYGVAANGVHVLGSPCVFNLAWTNAG